MGEFLEERLSVNVRINSTYGDEFKVDITKTRGGSEFRQLLHPFPERNFVVYYRDYAAVIWAQVLGLYYRAFGMYAGFRVRCLDDYSTNGQTGVPTALDQLMAMVSAGVYQLQKQYGLGGTPASIGLPVRTIFKPVAGTVLVAIAGVTVAGSGWTVSTITGRVTFSANKTGAITAISKALSAVISCAGHTFIVGESVQISGVLGMTQINGLRALITAVVGGVSITVAIDSTGFSTYTSGGAANTRPQVGEAVTAGCEFDIPCRFNSRIDVGAVAGTIRQVDSVDLVELLNP